MGLIWEFPRIHGNMGPCSGNPILRQVSIQIPPILGTVGQIPCDVWKKACGFGAGVSHEGVARDDPCIHCEREHHDSLTTRFTLLNPTQGP